jgi:hypothetical protein
MPQRPPSVRSWTGSSTSSQADRMSVGLVVKAPRRSLRPFLGLGRDGRFAVLARAALARSGGRRGGGPGLAATLLQRLAHPGQLQVAVVLLGEVRAPFAKRVFARATITRQQE